MAANGQNRGPDFCGAEGSRLRRPSPPDNSWFERLNSWPGTLRTLFTRSGSHHREISNWQTNRPRDGRTAGAHQLVQLARALLAVEAIRSAMPLSATFKACWPSPQAKLPDFIKYR